MQLTKSEFEMTSKDVLPGAVVTEPGNARAYKTGDWRSQKPTYNFDRCIKCAVCQIYCPEGCIEPNAEGYYEANMYYCKGCGICARECWTKVITMVEEG
jgi:pyruvate ferredoxin oxidoreductase delta subunit